MTPMDDLSAFRRILQGNSACVGETLDPRAYWVKVKRSSIPRGRIRGFVFPVLPPSVQILRSKDIPGRKTVKIGKVEVPLLNEGEIQYLGEPVLLLVGPDPELLETLMEYIVILYEELPPAFEIPQDRGASEPDRTAIDKTVVHGDPEKAFSQSFQVIEGEYKTGFQEHYYSEPHGAYVRWSNEDTSLEVHTGSIWPFHVHRAVQESLAVPWELVSVTIPSDPDTSLDGRLWYPSFVSVHAALAAWVTRKSVKYLYSREEDFYFSPKRSPASISLKAGLDTQGELLVLHGDIRFNVGAYPVFAEELVDRAIFALGASYGCSHISIRGRAFTSNVPPAGAFTGMGENQSQFALEVFTDEIREQLSASPLRWKEKNITSKARPNPWGIAKQAFTPNPMLLSSVQRASEFERKHAAYELLRKNRRERPDSIDSSEPLLGIGLVVGHQNAGFFIDREYKSKVEISLLEGNRVHLNCTAVPGSYALKSIWRRILSEELEVPLTAIQLDPIQTFKGYDCGPSVFSRNITYVTKLIKQCSQGLKKKLSNPPPIKEVKSYKPQPRRSWDRESFVGNPFCSISWAAAVVEVELDPMSLVPKIKNIVLSIDAGEILDVQETRRTIELGIAQAVGWSLQEFLAYIDGRVPKPIFQNYRISSSNDFPSPQIEFLTSIEGNAPRGVGELALAVIPPALINALSQALGKRFREIPIQGEVY